MPVEECRVAYSLVGAWLDVNKLDLDAVQGKADGNILGDVELRNDCAFEFLLWS